MESDYYKKVYAAFAVDMTDGAWGLVSRDNPVEFMDNHSQTVDVKVEVREPELTFMDFVGF
jgi:hypothetical protein